jgi:integrase
VIRAHAYSLLSTIMATAASEGMADQNPCTISGAGNTERRVKIKPATLAELETITNEMPERLQLMILLASWCSMRFGELAELRRKDVDPALIRVRRGMVRAGGQMIVTTPKSAAGSRDIAVPPHLAPVIEQHLEKHTAPGKGSLLFPAVNGGHLQPSALYARRARRDRVRLSPLHLWLSCTAAMLLLPIWGRLSSGANLVPSTGG